MGERGKRKRVKKCRSPFPPQNPIKEHEERIIPSHSINIIVYVSKREINYPTIIYDIFNHPVPAEPRSRFKNRDFHDFLFGLHCPTYILLQISNFKLVSRLPESGSTVTQLGFWVWDWQESSGRLCFSKIFRKV